MGSIKESLLHTSLDKTTSCTLPHAIELVAPLVNWLQGGHPYKADAASLLSLTSQDLQVRRMTARSVLDHRAKLSTECTTDLEKNQEDLGLVEKALKELSKQ